MLNFQFHHCHAPFVLHMHMHNTKFQFSNTVARVTLNIKLWQTEISYMPLKSLSTARRRRRSPAMTECPHSSEGQSTVDMLRHCESLLPSTLAAIKWSSLTTIGTYGKREPFSLQIFWSHWKEEILLVSWSLEMHSKEVQQGSSFLILPPFPQLEWRISHQISLILTNKKKAVFLGKLHPIN